MLLHTCTLTRLAYVLGTSALLTAIATAVTNLWAVPQLNAHVLPTATSTAAVALQRDVRLASLVIYTICCVFPCTCR